MRFAIKILLLYFGLFSCNIPSLQCQTISIKHYGVNDGVSQSEIKCIRQDSEGYLWIGTQNGVNKFDGYSFENFFYDPTNNSSVSNNWIFDISEDDDGNLWIGTKEGLNKYDKKTGNFSLVPHKLNDSIVPDNFVYGVLAHKDFIYINIPPVLSVYNYRNRTLESHYNQLSYDGALHDIGFPILKSSNGNIWLGSSKGLSVFNPENKTFSNFRAKPNTPQIIGNEHITALYEDNYGNILVGTENGLYFFDPKSEKFSLLEEKISLKKELSRNYIRSIWHDSEGAYWIGTEEGGLNKISPNHKTGNYDITVYNMGANHENFISHDIVYSLFEDRSRNLWIGTIAGLDKTDLKPKKFTSYKRTDDPNSLDLLDNVIGSIFIDDLNRLWIGNWANGLNIYNPKNEEVIHYTAQMSGTNKIPNNHVHVLYKDSENRIWMGTRNGVSIFNPQNQSFIPFSEYFELEETDFFRNNRVYCIEELSNNEIWLGTGNGIYAFNARTKSNKHFRMDANDPFKVSSNLVYSIMEDRDGYVWIATLDGLDRFHISSEQMVHFARDDSQTNTLCDNFTISLCEDHNGDIWIGTSAGVNRYNKKDSIFTYYSVNDGLPSNIIYDLIEDKNRNLWFSTGSGLAMLNTYTNNFKSYSINEGLQGVEFNLKAVFQSEKGQIYFGGMEGVISFHPDSLIDNTFIPPIVITSFTKERDGKIKKLNVYEPKQVLTHKDYSFTIEYAALDFTFPNKNRYAYKMVGLRDEWVEVGNRPFVHFTNLPHGHYNFMVKGTNNDGRWNDEPAELHIKILPPWWRSNLAYTIYFLLVLILIITTVKLRERRLQHEKKVLEDGIRERTAEIALQKERVEESKEKLKSTISSLDDLVFVLDGKGVFQEFYNPGNQDPLYDNPDFFLCKHYTEVDFPGKVIKELENAFVQLQKSNSVLEFDYCVKNEEVYWYNAKISPRRNPLGELTGITIVSRHITERKLAEQQMRMQKEELDELNATKDKFFSILAHDLKNPFASLYSLSQMLDENYTGLDEEDKIHSLKRIHESAELIYNLLENLLTWSKSQRGRIDYNPSNFSLSTLVQENINLHRLPADRKNIMLDANIDGNCNAYGDRQMINTVIRNLVNNAIKFTEPGKQITVKVQENKQGIQVEVKDQGVGISKENQDKLFRIDTKFKTTGTSGEKGTGLGLILCHEFIQKNKGKIWCESEMGKGSRFIFNIPNKKEFDS